MSSALTARLSRLHIVMYHSISDAPHDPYAIHPDVFEQQMRSLDAGGYTVLALGEALERLYQQRSMQRMVVLSFDDAYQNFVSCAVPILQSHGFPATVFVPTGYVGRTARWDNYEQNKPIMTWDELHDIKLSGFEVASHTVSHKRLSACSDDILFDELEGSLETLRRNLGNVLPVLSYPFGDFGPREIKAAHEVGYIGGVGIHSRWGNYPWSNPYRLEREFPCEVQHENRTLNSNVSTLFRRNRRRLL